MNTKRIGNMLQHKAYCGRHSIEQRKAFRQQYGPEDVKSMKQMRVNTPATHYLLKKDLYFASIVIGSTFFGFTN